MCCLHEAGGVGAGLTATFRVQVTRRVSVPLKVDVKHLAIPPLTAESKAASQKLLEEYSKREAAKRRMEQARNDLESYIVNTRGKLDDEDVVSVRLAALLQVFRCCIPHAVGAPHTPGTGKASSAVIGGL